MSLKLLGISGIAIILTVAPAFAHHAQAIYDFTKISTYQVTVKEFEWINPHSWLNVMIVEKDGKAYEYALELGSLVQIRAGGWAPDSVKPGDKITVVVAPMKDGSRSGAIRTAVLADGTRVSSNGNRVPGGPGLAPKPNQ